MEEWFDNKEFMKWFVATHSKFSNLDSNHAKHDLLVWQAAQEAAKD